MKMTFVVIPSVEEQRALNDRDIIDPETVRLPSMPSVLWRGLNYNVPRDVMGQITRFWVEDGRLMGEADVRDIQVAYGGFPGRDKDTFELISVGLNVVPKR